MHEKTCRLSKFGQQVELQINRRKTEVMTLNVNAPALVLLDDQALASTETFTYLGSVVKQDGGTKEDIQSRLSKARNAFRSLNAIWRSCLLYTSDAADESLSVDLGGRRIIKKIF